MRKLLNGWSVKKEISLPTLIAVLMLAVGSVGFYYKVNGHITQDDIHTPHDADILEMDERYVPRRELQTTINGMKEDIKETKEDTKYIRQRMDELIDGSN